MSDIKVFCVTCEKYYSVDSSYEGLDVECPVCGKILHVPGESPKEEIPSFVKELEISHKKKQNSANQYLFMKQFKRPILSQIFAGIAIVNFIFSLGPVMAYIMEKEHNISIYIFSFLGFIFAGMIFLGIAQLIDAVCKTAFYAQLIFEFQISKNKD